MLGRPALGYQDYEEVITENIFYIDKTHFIREWWEYGDKVTLITRPRRFGKTLNMSTLKCFFSNQYAGRSDLFEGKAVWDDEKLRQLQGTFPVIFMSFAAVKNGDIAGIRTAVKQIISDIYRGYIEILESEEFNDMDQAYFNRMIYDMSDDMIPMSINSLCVYLEKRYGKKVIVLLDEYDTPMQDAWLAGNWDQAVEFFRSFFNATFKTNDHIYKGIITGITRISRESNVSAYAETSEKRYKRFSQSSPLGDDLFSGMNNLKVVTATSDKYATCFGFLEEEVFAALDGKGLGSEKQGVKKWYDGFVFGTHADIYNPWSIISFIENNAKYEAYWSNTSGNGLVNSLIQKGNMNIKQTMEELLRGRSFETRID